MLDVYVAIHVHSSIISLVIIRPYPIMPEILLIMLWSSIYVINKHAANIIPMSLTLFDCFIRVYVFAQLILD